LIIVGTNNGLLSTSKYFFSYDWRTYTSLYGTSLSGALLSSYDVNMVSDDEIWFSTYNSGDV